MKLTRYILLSIFICVSALASNAQTAAQVLNKAASKIMSAGSVAASFSISFPGGGGSGSLKASGKCFTVSVPGSSSWYDGQQMWTYSASSKETTLFRPSASELAETNPLLYLAGGASSYNCAFAKGSSKSNYILSLTPKSRKTGIKSANISINGTTFAPTQISVKDQSGRTTTIKITNIRFGNKISASNFKYPKNKYPKIKIIDLR